MEDDGNFNETWTRQETTILLKEVSKYKDWEYISSQLQGKSPQSCSSWYGFLQQISSQLYFQHLFSIQLPPEVWQIISSFLSCKDACRLGITCSTLWKCVFENASFWKSYLLEKFPSFKDISEDHINFLNVSGDPYKWLVDKLTGKKGKFLYLTNEPGTLRDYFISMDCPQVWDLFDTIEINRHSTVSQVQLKNLSDICLTYDAVIITTNYGWPSDSCHVELGNIVKRMINNGIGVVTWVFCGCSWVETLGGDFQSNNCNPIVPNVIKNNVEGSQAHVAGDIVPKIANHVIFYGCESLLISTSISLGKAHPEGNEIATITLQDGSKIPFVVELKKFPGIVLSVNGRVSSTPKQMLLNTLLYVARK